MANSQFGLSETPGLSMDNPDRQTHAEADNTDLERIDLSIAVEKISTF